MFLKIRADNEFINIEGYKTNIEKSVIFLYTNNERCKNKIKKQFHLQ